MLGLLLLIAVVSAVLIFCAVRFGPALGLSRTWGVLSVVLAGACAVISVVGLSVGTIVSKTDGDPQEAAAAFLEAVFSGAYDTAYDMMYGYTSLGLENLPEDAAGQSMYRALRESYAYAFQGDCTVNKLEAEQTVRLTYLDLPSISADVQSETVDVLRDIGAQRPAESLYDEENHFLPEVGLEAYSIAVDNVLKHPEKYYTEKDIQLRLAYRGRTWQVVPDDALLSAIAGGAY